MKIQLTIATLELILNEAKAQNSFDKNLSQTVEIELISERDTHLGSDNIQASLKSIYGECESKLII